MSGTISDSHDAVLANTACMLTDFVTLTYASEVQKFLVELPKGALILGYCVEIVVANNDTGTSKINIGTYGTGTEHHYFLSDLDAKATAGVYRGNINIILAADTKIYCDMLNQNNNPSAGSARVGLIWVPWGSGGF